jgi:hypothetical protein
MQSSNEQAVQLQPNVPQFFFDDTLIARQQRLTRRWMPATVFPKPVLEADKPWEGRQLVLFGTILPMPDGSYRLYYSTFTPGEGHAKLLLATSADGFHWEKPELDLVEWDGSRANNIILDPDMDHDSPSIIFEPDDSTHPFKMITFHRSAEGSTWGLYGYRSADGLRWDRLPEPLLAAGDRTNMMATKPDGKYVVYTRHPEMMSRHGARSIHRSESDDFLHWSNLELMLTPDLDDEPDVEYYGMSVFMRHGWYFGLMEYLDGLHDCIETRLFISRDGRRWQKAGHAPFIGATYDWNRKWSGCDSHGPIIINDSMLFYFHGRLTSHHYTAGQQWGVIGYASLPVDQFCAIEATNGTNGGRLDTVPLEWPGGELVLNADTRESYASHPRDQNGEIAVEVLDAGGAPLPEWSGESKAVFHSIMYSRNRIDDGTVCWLDERKMDELKGRTIRLRLHLKHARLFTLAAGDGVDSTK